MIVIDFSLMATLAIAIIIANFVCFVGKRIYQKFTMWSLMHKLKKILDNPIIKKQLDEIMDMVLNEIDRK